MEKTQKILTRFISLILTFAISFGSYVFPVFAALPEDNEAPTIPEITSAYTAFKAKRDKLRDDVDTVKSGTMTPQQVTTVENTEEFLDSIDTDFGFKNGEEKLLVKTTEYNVITVEVDFTESDLGIVLTNNLMKNQVLKDLSVLLKRYDDKVTNMAKYFEQTGTYLDKLNELNLKIANIEKYIKKITELKIEYDNAKFVDYNNELNRLKSAEASENLQTAEDLSTVLDKYLDDNTNNTGLVQILKKGLLDKYTELNTLATTNIAITGMDAVKLATEIAIASLNADTYNLLSTEYETQLNNYNNLVLEHEKTTNSEKYIDTKIEEINKLFSDTFNLKITKEQMELINNLMVDTPLFNIPLTIENLVSNMKTDELTEKLISGELNYEALEAYVAVINNHVDILNIESSLYSDFNSDNELLEYIEEKIETDVLGPNGGYLKELNDIGRVSKSDEERLEVLNKLNLIEYLAENLLQNSPELLTPITTKIAELREFYNKSADNTLKSLTVNGIEMDVAEEKYKVYVGNDVTEIKVLFNQSNDKAKVEVLNAKDLKVGSNEVIVIVTAENGEVRQYTIEVIRAEATPVVTTTENKIDDEVETITLNNSVVEDTETEEEHKNTSDSNEKYNEEVEEKEGLSALTVLLIVIGIAIIAYGIYKIFGEKEDKKIEKAFEQPKVNKNKPNPKKNNKSKKRK